MDMNINGIEFERICQSLVEKMGFTTQMTKASGDGGIDLIAYNHQPLLSGKYIIQCKRYAGSVGEPIIRDLYGVVTSERANKGILMTTGHFTKSAIAFSAGKPIELIDGEKLKSLFINYGVYNEDVGENDISIEEVFESNIMIEDEYDNYMNSLQELKVTNDEISRAKFINQLLSWTLDEYGCYIDDFNHKLVLFKEIKSQIAQYINNPRIPRSKYLAYIYQMVYVQISILQGNFNDAVTMFLIMMENKELQFTLDESFEPKYTKALWCEHSGMFWCLYYTFYDMMQLAVLLDDFNLQTELQFDDKYYGYPSMAYSTLNKALTKNQESQTGKVKYLESELEALKNIEHLNSLYLFSWYESNMYFEYTYLGKAVENISLDRYKICVDDDKLIIDGWGEVNNIQRKINRYHS